MPFDPSGYKHIPGNSLIRAAGQNTNYIKKELEEYHKCKKDYYYFVENYCYIKTLKSSKLELFVPRDYQHRMIDTVIENNYTVIRCGRQMGKCVLGNSLITIKKKNQQKQILIKIKHFHYITKLTNQIKPYVLSKLLENILIKIYGKVK